MEVKAYGLFIEVPCDGMVLQFPVHATHDQCAKDLVMYARNSEYKIEPLVSKADADAALAEANRRYDARENEAHELSEQIIKCKRLIAELKLELNVNEQL